MNNLSSLNNLGSFIKGGRGTSVTPFSPSDIGNQIFWGQPDTGLYTNAAAQITRANQEYLSVANNASLQTGDIDFSVGGWVYLTNLGGSHNSFIAGQRKVSTTTGWVLWWSGTTAKFRMSVYNSSGTLITAEWGTSPLINTWYFVEGYHDATNDLVGITVNADTPVTAAMGAAGSAADPDEFFGVGQDPVLGAFNYMDGRVDSLLFTKRLLTATEKTWLYNSGNGRVYDDIGVVGNDGADLKTSLVSWWDLNEASGTRLDAHGSNDLTDNNTVTQAAGIARGLATNGDTIVLWEDQGAASNDLSQATLASRPIYDTADLGAYGAMRFDGTNDQLLKAALSMTTGPATIYAVFRQKTWTDTDYLITLSDDSTPKAAIQQTTTTPEISLTDTSADIAANTGLVLNTYAIGTFIFDTASSSIQIDDGTPTTGDTGASLARDGISIGARGDAANFGNLDIVELIVYEGAHDATQQSNVRTYLNNLYSIY